MLKVKIHFDVSFTLLVIAVFFSAQVVFEISVHCSWYYRYWCVSACCWCCFGL